MKEWRGKAAPRERAGGKRDQRSERDDRVSCLSVTLRRGRTGARGTLRYLGVLGSAALAAAAALGGCSSSVPPAKAATHSAHALTLGQAQAIYNLYVTKSTAAARQGNAKQGLAIVGDAQWAIMHSRYTALASRGTPVTQYSYGTPVFYVPALPGYPFWFAVAVPVRTDAGGHLGPAASTLLVFQKFNPSRQWTLDGSAVLDRPLPAIVRDSAGYAVGVSNTDSSLLLPPELVGATQAAVVDEGPAAPAAAVIGSGQQTTGMYTSQNAQENAASALGLNYEWLMQSASYAQYELQTAGGGALVIYGMYLNTVTEHPGNVSGTPIPVPANFSPLLPVTSAELGVHGVDANWTYEFAAVDPPATAHGAKVEVIGGSGAPTFGHAY
jgi:hypothetical protein